MQNNWMSSLQNRSRWHYAMSSAKYCWESWNWVRSSSCTGRINFDLLQSWGMQYIKKMVLKDLHIYNCILHKNMFLFCFVFFLVGDMIVELGFRMLIVIAPKTPVFFSPFRTVALWMGVGSAWWKGRRLVSTIYMRRTLEIRNPYICWIGI